MKFRLISCLLLFLTTITAYADLIVKKDGTTLNVYNIDVGTKFITFTKDASPEFEIGRISIDECFAVKIGDGEMRNIGTTDNMIDANSKIDIEDRGVGPVFVPAIPSADNDELIQKYNTSIPKLKKPNKEGKVKKAANIHRILGITDYSVLSDSVVTISFEQISSYFSDFDDNSPWRDRTYRLSWGHEYYKWGVYKIKVTNKSAKNIYVDMANSFRICSNGEAGSFYSNTSISHTSNSGGGVGANLGAVAGALGVGGFVGTLASGVNVGKGNSEGTVITETQDAIVIIPPGGTIVMPQRIAISPNGKKVVKNYENLSVTPITKDDDNERSFMNNFKKRGFLFEKGKYYTSSELLKFQGDEDIMSYVKAGNINDMKISYIITYSADSHFSKYTSLNFGLFTRGFLGVGQYFYPDTDDLINEEFLIIG